MSRITKLAPRIGDVALADKAIYGNQTFANRIDSKEKTFESYGTEERRTVGRNEAGSGDFSAVQRQTCLCNGSDVPLSARNDYGLRASGLELKSFRKRAGYHAKSSAGVDQKLDFFGLAGRSGQMSFYVQKSHLNDLITNRLHCSAGARQRNNADSPPPRELSLGKRPSVGLTCSRGAPMNTLRSCI